MGKIEKILKKGPVKGQTTEVYPVTSTKAVYDENNKRLDNIITGLQESVYLNTPIPISTENTPESKAQNVKNIADYVEKAKAAGIADVNGMAVTCIINNDYSGVGYLYGDSTICGIKTNDALGAPSFFDVDPSGSYHENEVLVKGLSDQITSDMLVEGARKPIIITGDMTEVDEETYQKLSSQEGTDVILNLGDGTFVELQGIFNTGDTLNLTFGYSQFGESNDGVIATYTISINTSAPHTLTLAAMGTCEPVSKSTLTPVLQEIDLTGTDADRKAKLDKFETDWKALTGASDLKGARFVGLIDAGDYGYVTALFIFDYNMGVWEGIGNRDDSKQCRVQVNPTGTLHITPLFSHLEAITIYTDNTPEHMQANLDNIAAYEANLEALGVDTAGIKAPIIPIYTDDSGVPGFIQRNDTGLNDWTGICTAKDGLSQITISIDSGKATVHRVALYKDVVDKSHNAKSLEAITIRIGNTPDDKAANVAAIKAYVDNLIALGVDVTKGYMIPVKLNNGYHGFIMGTGADGGHTGVIKRNTYNYGGGYIFIDNIGTYQYLEFLTSGSYDLTTTAKTIVPAINEVNALAKGYSTIFTPIELTTETAQNKTAIDARVAAFTAQGISLTNGCCIPVTYKGVYTGNISLINGDWYGLLVKNTNNPADNINIKLSADGTITEGNSV